MQAWHQKNLLEPDFPFELHITENLEFPPHWHEEFEIIYVLDGQLDIGVNNEIYTLNPTDILIIQGGDVHHFLPPVKWSKKIIMQFGLSLFGSFSSAIADKKISTPLLRSYEAAQSIQNTYNKKGTNQNAACNAHEAIEAQILAMIYEYTDKPEGYKIALKARLYDLLVCLIRLVPMTKYLPQEKIRKLGRLERLEQVFEYVDNNYDRPISLGQIARVANFSIYHFTRFFKETTGMTFGEYLNSYRVKKAESYLRDAQNTITEIAFKSGFNSIKTFNRVFKHQKGCSPSEYRKLLSDDSIV